MSGGAPSVVAISGPMLLGFMFNWGLLGVLSVQIYYYLLAFPKDRRTTKSLVVGLYLLELTQSILLAWDAFRTYGTHYGDVRFLNNMQLLPLLIPIFTGLVSLPVQIFYGCLLRKLSDSLFFGLLVVFVAIVQCSAALVQGIQAFIIKDFSALANKTLVSDTIWLSGSAICDLTIAFGMTFVLLRMNTGLPDTHAIVTRLVRIIVETGSLTAATATVQMILFISLPDKPYYTCVGAALSKLYSNSLLAILNNRIRIEGVHAHTSFDETVSSLAFRAQSATNCFPSQFSFSSTHVCDENGNSSRIIDVQSLHHSENWKATDDAVSMDDNKKVPDSRHFETRLGEA